MCSTALTETIEYYVSRKTPVYVLLFEANLPCYSFLSMDSIMPICTTTLYHFDRVTDPEI